MHNSGLYHTLECLEAIILRNERKLYILRLYTVINVKAILDNRINVNQLEKNKYGILFRTRCQGLANNRR